MKTSRLGLLSACFFLSGLAGLIYQTAWTHQLALVFGTSEEAVVAVLAAYMGGLALGAMIAGRWIERIQRPILTYGLLELGIGLAALSLPFGIAVAAHLQEALFGSSVELSGSGSTGSTIFYLATSFALLLVPTSFMGATLPLLARHAVRREAEIGPIVALLYGANTGGAALGALFTAFLLLPNLGLRQTIGAAVCVNLVVFLLAVLLVRDSRGDAFEPTSKIRRQDNEFSWILPAVLLSGIVSFSLEITWTRLLAHLLGGSVYAFAVMLASFLVALALGSALAAPFASSPERARQGFAGAQIAIATLTTIAFAAADHLPALTRAGAPAQLLAGAILFPGALAIGATFPCAVRVLARDTRSTAVATARVVTWNTIGAIAGSLLTGYILLPKLGFAGAVTLVVIGALALALVASLAARPILRAISCLAVLGLVILAVNPPTTPWSMLRHCRLASQPVPGAVTHLAVGRSATVLLTEHNGEWRLLNNGLPESSIESSAHRPGRHLVARWLGLLPLAARPETRSLLVVGLGAGITIEDIPASIETIDVIELEPEVVQANLRVARQRRQDPLADERLRVHINDARGALRLTGRRFDAIVSQPSHPWTSGSSLLYTREFFSLVASRLTPDGVFVQWMALAFVDEALMRSLVATASDVFPFVEVYRPHPGSVLLLASEQPLEVAASAGRAVAAAPREWAESGVLCLEDVLAARILDNAGVRSFGHGASLITDSRNLLRMRSSRILDHPLGPFGADRLFAEIGSLPRVSDQINALYLVRRLIRQRDLEGARRLARVLEDPAARHTALGLIELATGQIQRGRSSLGRALKLRPNDTEAFAALLAIQRPVIARGQPTDLTQNAGPEIRTVVDGWRLEGAGDWIGLRNLEEPLAALDPRHPLFTDAVRLRVLWRVESGEAESARLGLDLLAPLLAPVPEHRDLVLRARLGTLAGQPSIALSAIDEAMATPSTEAASGSLARDALHLVASLELDPSLEPWRLDLQRRLSGQR